MSVQQLEARIGALEAEIKDLKATGAIAHPIPPPGPLASVPVQDSAADLHGDAPVPLPAPVGAPAADVLPKAPPVRFEPNYDHPVANFELMGLKPELVAALRENGCVDGPTCIL